jgi:hypothetical protein
MRIVRVDGREEDVGDPKIDEEPEMGAGDGGVVGTSVDVLTPLGRRDRDPHRQGVADPRALVWKMDAFPSFAPSSSYELMRRLLSQGSRRGARRARAPLDPKLPAMRCGWMDASHHRCGITVRARRRAGTTYEYRSTHCIESLEPHAARFSPVVEGPILSAIATAYRAVPLEELGHLVEGLEREKMRQLAGLQDRLADVEQRIRRMVHANLETRDRLREALVLTMEHDLSERDALRAALMEARETQRSTGDPVLRRRVLNALRSLAGRVQQLFALAAPVPGATRRLVRLLTTTIALRRIAPKLTLAEITFPHGVTTELLILTGPVWTTQPQRLWAYTQRQRGRERKAIARELAAGRLKSIGSREFTPDEVDSVALLHKYFEEVPALVSGPGETISALAHRTGAEERELWHRVMQGVLGPARLDADGALVVAPGEACLEQVFMEYARQQTARRAGWAYDDTRAFEQQPLLSTKQASVLKQMLRRQAAAATYDLVGRRYVNWQRVTHEMERAGMPLTQSSRQEAQNRAFADAVLAAGFPAAWIPCFHSARDLVEHFRKQTQTLRGAMMLRSASERRLLVIPCRAPRLSQHGRSTHQLIYCPPEVFSSVDASVVRSWMRGEHPIPEPPGTRSSGGGLAPSTRRARE